MTEKGDGFSCLQRPERHATERFRMTEWTRPCDLEKDAAQVARAGAALASMAPPVRPESVLFPREKRKRHPKVALLGQGPVRLQAARRRFTEQPTAARPASSRA